MLNLRRCMLLIARISERQSARFAQLYTSLRFARSHSRPYPYARANLTGPALTACVRACRAGGAGQGHGAQGGDGQAQPATGAAPRRASIPYPIYW